MRLLGGFSTPFGGDGERICNGYVRPPLERQVYGAFLVGRVVDL